MKKPYRGLKIEKERKKEREAKRDNQREIRK